MQLSKKKNLNYIHGIKNQNNFPDQNVTMLTILCALVTSHSLALRNRTKTSSGYPWCIFWKLSKSGYKTKFHLYTSQVENSLILHKNARTTTRRIYENILRKKKGNLGAKIEFPEILPFFQIFTKFKKKKEKIQNFEVNMIEIAWMEKMFTLNSFI